MKQYLRSLGIAATQTCKNETNNIQFFIKFCISSFVSHVSFGQSESETEISFQKTNTKQFEETRWNTTAVELFIPFAPSTSSIYVSIYLSRFTVNHFSLFLYLILVLNMNLTMRCRGLFRRTSFWRPIYCDVTIIFGVDEMMAPKCR